MLGAVILLLLVVSCVVVVTSRETKSALVVVLIGDEQQEVNACWREARLVRWVNSKEMVLVILLTVLGCLKVSELVSPPTVSGTSRNS